MKEALKELGMTDAFIDGSADFSKINSGDIFISSVLHKTFITVDENGTKAAAVTKVELNADAVEIIKEVKLDRPFVYVIIDNTTNLPIFIGTVMSV